jgi:hypothetical protein
MGKDNPVVTIKVEVEEDGLKRLMEAGKLVAFVDALPAMMAGSLKGQIVEKLAVGELAGSSATLTFVIDDFPTPPWPWPGPWADVGTPAITVLRLRQG